MRTHGIIATLTASLLLVSCTHKELCLNHHHTARVRIETDWTDFTVEKPTGMSVHIYGEDGGEVRSTLSNNTSYVDVELEPGRYDALVFNQSPSEFGTIRFENLDNRALAAVRNEYITRLWFKSDADEQVLQEPEWLGTEVRHGLEVNREMMEASPQIRSTKSADFPQSNVIATLVPQNIIYTITVTVRINGIHNLKAARASLSGLASGYLLGEGHVMAETGIQLLEEWTMTRDEKDPTKGTISATITSFGLPYGHIGNAQDNVLQLSLLLNDNKTKLDYVFPSGDSFVKDKDNALVLTLYKEIGGVLPDVKPVDGSAGGFDAKVDDWGDEEIIDIPV